MDYQAHRVYISKRSLPIVSPSRNPLPQQIGAHHKRVKTRQSENNIWEKIYNKYLTQIFQHYRVNTRPSKHHISATGNHNIEIIMEMASSYCLVTKQTFISFDKFNALIHSNQFPLGYIYL